MSPSTHTSLDRDGPRELRGALRPAIAIALVITAIRILYLVFVCPYDLVEDEAQYWLWAQHLDWSYYSKGPGVAWAIAAATAVFGDAEWAVRIPALVSGLVAMIAAAGLGAEAAIAAGADARDARRAAVCAMAAFALAPVFQMTAILMTIDGPLVACWMVAAWAAWRALLRGSRAAWIVLGAAVAVGFLFKYTMLLVLPGLVGLAVARRRELVMAAGWRVWCVIGVVVALVGLVPVVVWNAQNGWDTVRHLLGHVGATGGDMPVAAAGQRTWSPWWSLELIGMQIGLAGPALALGVWAAARMRADAVLRGASPLVWCAAPVLAFYLVVSLFAEPEGNWPIAGSTTLLVLAGLWAGMRAGAGAGDAARARAQEEGPPRGLDGVRLLWRAAVVYGVCAAPVLLRADWAAAGATRIVQSVNADARPIRTGRLIGASTMGDHAARILRELDGEDRAFVIVEHYGRASQLAYYLNGRDKSGREVLCASAAMGGRRSQFDLWEHTDLRRAELIGRDALLLSNDKPHTLEFWRSVFDTVEPIPGGKLEGEHKRDRVAYIGRGYRGLAARTAAGGEP